MNEKQMQHARLRKWVDKMHPCPFDGGLADLRMLGSPDRITGYAPFCRACNCELNRFMTARGAVERWNRRTA